MFVVRKERDILRYRAKYGHGGVYCKICGQPTDSLLLRCERCMEAIYHGHQLEHVRSWMKEHPEERLEIGRDPKKRKHLVLPISPFKTAWCGEHVSQKREGREIIQRELFPPPGFCDRCVEVYEDLI